MHEISHAEGRQNTAAPVNITLQMEGGKRKKEEDRNGEAEKCTETGDFWALRKS